MTNIVAELKQACRCVAVNARCVFCDAADEIEMLRADIITMLDERERVMRDEIAHEREACARVCEGMDHLEGPYIANEFAAAIRARGNDENNT